MFLGCITDKQSAESNFLTAKSWLLESTEIQRDGKWVIEAQDDCKKDNIYEFRKNGTFVILSGPQKCTAGDPDELTSGIWKITNDGSRLIAKVSASNRDLDIVELNSKAMVLTLERNGQQIRERYKH